MRFFIVDDDDAIRSILSQIIEDGDLGEVVGEALDGDQLTGPFLNMQKVDILFVDLLMPVRDGIETIRHLEQFKGKMIMISQVESKELISEAYALGVEYYIMKPINRIEIVTVIRKVMERIQLEKSIQEIKTSLSSLLNLEDQTIQSTEVNEKSIANIGEFLLAELGIVGENGSRDLIDILECLFSYERVMASEQSFPSLKEIFKQVAQKKLGSSASEMDINREMKASEQRIRRAIAHSLIHFASLGLTDYTNPKFENYASKFFDFMAVRQKMRELQEDSATSFTPTKVNTKKFIQVFFFEAKRLYKDI
ncbi:response regulator [Domibacillus mangrovi]|uniref:Transcriptional regulator n=1 Tax=Domibacillus mangrovi TaxID=1714354 RepID=A0A1Q5P6Q8_9BACI|nr:response regulator [Domibacillus mangrovi]OKL37927.1 transcriptional regulator [Domibacillus mangrovi]